MRRYIPSLFAKLVMMFMLVPQIVFGYNLLKPHIKNEGQYLSNPKAGKDLRPLYGHVLVDVNQATRMQAMEGSKILKLSIVLSLNNEEELNKKLIALTDPNSPDYQHFLSQTEFMATYSPTVEQVEKAKDYLERQGMHVESIAPNRLIIRASGAVAAIEKIFNTKIYYYADKAGKTFYAPAYELQVAKDLTVLSVLGLENRIKLHPNYRILKKVNASKPSVPSAGPTEGFTPAGIKEAYSHLSSLDGTGQTLALFELDGYTASDITAYENAFNLPHVTLENVLVDGATGNPSNSGGPAEVTLDIELMTALAPGVTKIIVYEGPNSGTGVVDTYNRIATDNLAKSISTSWGEAESASSRAIIQAEAPIFAQMVAQGQPLYAAAGDAGAYDNDQSLSVDDPSSQPYVVAVGGTTLMVNSDGSYKSETTWSSGSAPDGEGGGGGISSIWGIPSWQQGVIAADTKGSTTMRNTPDVSLNANPNTGYAILYRGEWTVFGGTSCAAPLWAAFTALVNQARSDNGLGVLGFPNPTIYALGQSANYASTFHDIVVGTNLYYPAESDFDDATGWGSFIIDSLADYLAGSISPPTCATNNPTVSISPASQQSLAGGALTYKVTVADNDGNGCNASNFNLTATVPSGFGDSLSQSSLNLSPGSSKTVMISLASATGTAAGSYPFSVSAVNATTPSYSGSASATYVVNVPQSQLSLTVSPQNGRFLYNEGEYVNFQFTLMNGQNPIPNNLVSIQVKGPGFTTLPITRRTSSKGVADYMLYLDESLPAGSYTITATAQYNGTSVSGKASFTIYQ